MSLNPRLIDVFTNIIVIHIAAKDFSRAHQRCDRQMEILADVPVALAGIQSLKGEIYLAEGKKSDAVTWYKKALETYPGYMRPYYALARIYRAEKNEKQAIGQYEAARAAAADYRDIFGAENFYCELMDHGLGIERRAGLDVMRNVGNMTAQAIAAGCALNRDGIVMVLGIFRVNRVNTFTSQVDPLALLVTGQAGRGPLRLIENLSACAFTGPSSSAS